MKTKFDDRIQNFTLPPSTKGSGVSLTRRNLLGILTAGAIAGLPRATRAAGCSIGAFAHESYLTSLSFFPDGKTIVSAGKDDLVKFWTVPDGALFRSITTQTIPVQVTVSPDGRHIAVAMQSGHLELWSADGGTRRTLTGHTNTVNSVAFTPDSAHLVSVSLDRTTKLWSVAEATLLRSFSDTSVMSEVAVPPFGRPLARGRGPERRLLVTGGAQIYLRQLANGALLQTAAGQTFAISPDGKFLAAHDTLRLYMYAFPSLTPLATLLENQGATSLSFSADGRRLAISYVSSATRLYSAPDLTPIANLPTSGEPTLSTAMDRQNRYLALADGRSIHLYTLPSGVALAICFMDIAASAPSAEGLQYIWDGEFYTVGCGASLPFAYACSCNCVPGDCPCVYDTGCSCDSDTGCNCVGDSGCSCDSDTGCSCVGDVGCSCDSDTGCNCVGDTGCSCDSDTGCGCVGDVGCSCNSDIGCSCVGDVGCSCDSDYGCGCVGDSGCACDGDVGYSCGCDGDSGCGCDGDLGR